jgi:nitroreductase
MLPGAPLAMVILEKQGMRAPLFTEQDLGAAVQNLMLQAVEDGLGSVWMGVGRGTERETFLTEMFNLPETVKPFAVLAIGYPADENANKFVDRYDETRVHYNKY